MQSLDTSQLLALAAAIGWASGIRLYLVVFLTGLTGYLGWVELPHGLQLLSEPAVMWISGFMVLLEFFVDKIPGLDSLWDMIHTLIRIPAAAALAASTFGWNSGTTTLLAGLMGGTLAASSHLAKASARAALNTSPEPFSNWLASIAEDTSVPFVLWLSMAHPVVLAIVLTLITFTSAWLIYLCWRYLNWLFRKFSKPTLVDRTPHYPNERIPS